MANPTDPYSRYDPERYGSGFFELWLITGMRVLYARSEGNFLGANFATDAGETHLFKRVLSWIFPPVWRWWGKYRCPQTHTMSRTAHQIVQTYLKHSKKLEHRRNFQRGIHQQYKKCCVHHLCQKQLPELTESDFCHSAMPLKGHQILID